MDEREWFVDIYCLNVWVWRTWRSQNVIRLCMVRGRIMPYILAQRRDRATQLFIGLARETAFLQKRDGGSGT